MNVWQYVTFMLFSVAACGWLKMIHDRLKEIAVILKSQRNSIEMLP